MDKQSSPKITEGKIDMNTLIPEFLEGVAEIRTLGDKKYGKDSWRDVPKEEWVSAMQRHLLKYRKGEIVNADDWGHHHMLHIAVGAMLVYANDVLKGIGKLMDSEEVCDEADAPLTKFAEECLMEYSKKAKS